MLNINFNLKSVKHDNERPINMVVRWNNKKLVYSTQQKIHPKYFETEKGKKLAQRVRSTFSGFSDFNFMLDNIESTTGTAFRQFINDNKRIPEPHELKKILHVKLRNAQEHKKPTFFQFISSFIEDAENHKINRETGTKLSKETIRKYRNTLKRLKEFEPLFLRKIDFDSIDLDFYDRWMEYLSKNLQLCNNTIGGYTKTLKVFLNEATDLGLNTNLTFRNKRFKVLTESVYKIYLNENELKEIYNLDLTENKRLERVRDLFLVGCWTGLRFGDLSNIAPENVIGDKISIKTQKTGEVVVLPFHWMVKSIMKRYSDYPNSLPPAISNTKMNEYLKEISSMVDSLKEKVQLSVTKGGKLTTESKAKWECVTVHTARRSFATNLYLQNMSSLTIMKLTSHKSEKVFLNYLKASPEENANLLRKHWMKKEEAEEATGITEHQNSFPHQPQLAG